MREILDRKLTERGEIQLQRRDTGVYEIIFNGIFLMASYNDNSARILAKATMERLLPTTDGYRILVAGLGMGFTLQEVLACSLVSRAFVIEIEEAVIDWNRHHFFELNSGVLDDPRAVVVHSDLFDFLSQTWERFDAILVDVDNGPNWLASDQNRRLYSRRILRRIKAILARHGILATWSAQRDGDYLEKLGQIFPKAEELRVKETVPTMGESLIYVGIAR